MYESYLKFYCQSDGGIGKLMAIKIHTQAEVSQRRHFHLIYVFLFSL